MRIVETDNYGSDYSDEKFVNLPPMPEEACQMICDIVNRYNEYSGRYYKVVEDSYKLVPGFEP